jgi:diguanylate cyclase (GGDEF)-like protein
MTTRAEPPDDSREHAAQAVSSQILAGGAVKPRHGRRPAQTVEARLDAADKRDVVAEARDRAARTRDDAADVRGRAGALRVVDPLDGTAPGRSVIATGSGRRSRMARQRARAVERGALAALDRRAAAGDREQAACERVHALVDREELADELATADIDPLTGARTRAAGLAALERELQRCRRTGVGLVVVYVDVIGLKALNDTQGHGAGDDLLRRVVRHMYENLRTYDLVIRLGGDEFLCAVTDMSTSEARRRFAAIGATLAVMPDGHSLRTGFAEHAPGETAAQLIARADGQLINRPHSTHGAPVAALADGVPRPHARIPARPENIAPLRRAVLAFATANGASERQGEDIAIAVSEALGNAAAHAYADRPSPGVATLDAWMSEGALHVVVCDEGSGIQLPRRGPGLDNMERRSVRPAL